LAGLYTTTLRSLLLDTFVAAEPQPKAASASPITINLMSISARHNAFELSPVFRRRPEPHTTQEPIVAADKAGSAGSSKINNLRYRFLESVRRRQDARPRLVKMYRVPPDRA